MASLGSAGITGDRIQWVISPAYKWGIFELYPTYQPLILTSWHIQVMSPWVPADVGYSDEKKAINELGE